MSTDNKGPKIEKRIRSIQMSIIPLINTFIHRDMRIAQSMNSTVQSTINGLQSSFNEYRLYNYDKESTSLYFKSLIKMFPQ